jgi:hypothetical protein
MSKKELIVGALRLKEIDQLILSAVINDDISTLSALIPQFRELKLDLKFKLAQSSTINVPHRAARNILQQLDSGHSFHTDDLISTLEKREHYPFFNFETHFGVKCAFL